MCSSSELHGASKSEGVAARTFFSRHLIEERKRGGGCGRTLNTGNRLLPNESSGCPGAELAPPATFRCTALPAGGPDGSKSLAEHSGEG